MAGAARTARALAAARHLNRLELMGEMPRAALNAFAAAAPKWLRAIAPVDWRQRGDCRLTRWTGTMRSQVGVICRRRLCCAAYKARRFERIEADIKGPLG